MGILSKVVTRGVAKEIAEKEAKAVAKRGSEVMNRGTTKNMGMVEEVERPRLPGPKAEEAAKSAGRDKAIAAASAAAATAAVVAANASRKKEAASESGRGTSYQEERPTRDSGRVTSRSEEATTAKSESAKPSTFGAAFKEARSEGKGTFTYEGKKYTTEMAGEKKPAEKPTGVREGRNENIDEDTRSRAMASVANLAKGGMVVNKGIGASMKPHNVFGKKK